MTTNERLARVALCALVGLTAGALWAWFIVASMTAAP